MNKSFLFGVAVLMNIVWSFSYPLTKEMMASVSPLGLTWLRMLLASALLLPFVRREHLPAKFVLKDILLLLIMGAVGCAGATLLQYCATHRTLASNISFIVGLETPVLVVLAAFFLKERFRLVDGIVLLLGFAGVLFLTVDSGGLSLWDSQYFVGNSLMLLSITAYCIYTVCGKLLVTRWGVQALTAIPFAVAGLIMSGVLFFQKPEVLSEAISFAGTHTVALLYIGMVATALGYAIWNWLLKFLTASQLGYSLLVQPLSGAMFAAMWLGEAPDFLHYIGGVLILIALLFQQFHQRFFKLIR